jgi:hypothetical protein
MDLWFTVYLSLQKKTNENQLDSLLDEPAQELLVGCREVVLISHLYSGLSDHNITFVTNIRNKGGRNLEPAGGKNRNIQG